MQVRTLPCGTTVWGHDGGVPGFASLALTTPDAQKRVALNAATSPDVGDPSSVLERILGEVFC